MLKIIVILQLPFFQQIQIKDPNDYQFIVMNPIIVIIDIKCMLLNSIILVNDLFSVNFSPRLRSVNNFHFD